MPHDLPVPALGGSSPPIPVPAVAGKRVVEPVPAPAPPGHPLPNPSLRLDAGLGMVVLEFRDETGALTGSIPSQRILKAYRTHAEPMPHPKDGQDPTAPPAAHEENPESFA